MRRRIYTLTHAHMHTCQTGAQLDMGATDLQHGLVRWVQNYGDHVFRTLIQRSPKLPHHSPRRHSSSSTSSSSGTNGSGTKSRSKVEPTAKSRYRMTPDLLTPPFTPVRPPAAFQAPLANHSPTHNFYGMGLVAPCHMSPTAMAPGLVNNQQGMLVRMPALLPSTTVAPQQLPTGQHQVAHAQAGGMVYHQLPQQYGIQQQQQQQPTSGVGSPGASLVLQGQHGVAETVGKEGGNGGHTSSVGVGVTSEGGGNLAGNMGTEIISKLMQIQQHSASAFHQVPSQQHHMGSNLPEQQQHQAQVGGGGGGGGGGGMVSALQLPGDHTQPRAASVTTHPAEHQPSQLAAAHLPHHFIPSTLPPPHTTATVEHTEALLPIPHVVPSITPLTAIGPGSHPPTPPLLSNRKEILCRYFVAGQGHCPYGEKCWFAHPEPHLPQREFTSMPQTTIPSSPLHIQVPAQPHVWNPSLPNIPMQYLASPPQSPLSGYLASTDPSGIRTPILHPTPSYPFPGQPPILFWQPSPGRGPRNLPLLPSVRPPLSIPIDPRLHFTLLAEVVVQSDNPECSVPIRNISQLTTRADHFFISFENKVQDYKILFSGSHSCKESWVLQDTFSFTHKVTCVHSSRQQQFLLLVGTDAGFVYACSLRRGNQYSTSTAISHICTVEVSDICCYLFTPTFCMFMCSLSA